MPEATVICCPECDRKLRVPDHMLGKKVKCPGCQNIFVARTPDEDDEEEEERPAPARSSSKPVRKSDAIEETPRSKKPAPPRRRDEEDEDEDDEDDRPARRSTRDEDEDEDEDEEEMEESRPKGGVKDWRRIRSGVNYLIISTFVEIGGMVVLPIMACIGAFLGAGMVANAAANAAARGGGPNPAQMQGALMGVGIGMIVFYGIALLVALTVIGFTLTGIGMYLGAPSRRGVALAGLGMTAFILYCCTVVFPLVMIGVLFFLPMAALVFYVLTLLCYLGGFYCQLFLLKGTSQAVDQPGTAKGIMAHIISWACAHGLYLLLLIAMIALLGTAFFTLLGGGGGLGGPPGRPVAPNQGGLAVLQGGYMILNILGCLLGLAFLGLFIWYVVILFQVRGGLDRFLRRR